MYPICQASLARPHATQMILASNKRARAERRFQACLAVVLVLAVMAYARIEVDVNMAEEACEEAELWRLERGCASPRARPAIVESGIGEED